MQLKQIIILALNMCIGFITLQAINQQIIFRNDALENIFVTIDVLNIIQKDQDGKVVIPDKFVIPHGTSKNYFVPLDPHKEALFLTIYSSSIHKEYRIKYDAQNHKLMIQRNDFVLDEIDYSNSSNLPIIIVYNQNYEARFQR